MHPQGRNNKGTLNLSQKIFNTKLDLIYELQALHHQENEEHKHFYDKWKTEVINKIKKLNRNLINVKHNLQYVDKYSNDKVWDYIGVLDLKELKKQITFLIDPSADGETAKIFDLWLFNMELTELVGEDDYSKAIQAVTSICSTLLTMTTIPAIAAKKDFLKEVTTDEFWTDITVTKLEKLREEVRDLIKFIPSPSIEPIQTNFTDNIQPKKGEHLRPQFKNYKQRVIDYLAENVDSPVIHKIRNVIPLNKSDLNELQRILWEELGTQNDYENISDGEPLGVFVRKIVGLDRDAVSKIFSDYLAQYNYNAQQEEFLHQIVTFVLENGDIEPKCLIQDEPFTYIDYNEIFNGNTDVVFALISKLHSAINIAA
jgi:type I restriction enzyme R subunit